jgi:hypothetical protein
MQSVATITTPQAARYLTQLCKHFEHKFAVSHNGGQGRIPFPMGACALTAADGILTLTAEAPDEAALAQLENVVERHLVRFAFREDLALTWHPRPLPTA